MNNALAVSVGIATQTVAKASLAVLNMDTTVQDKAVAFPIDARLLHKATIALVRRAKKLGVPLRQSYREVGRSLRALPALRQCSQYERAAAHTRKLRTYLDKKLRLFLEKAFVHLEEA